MTPNRIFESMACANDEEAKPAFNVVIVYDSRDAATRAMNLFTGLVNQFGGDFELHCDLWRFDVLGLREAQREAVSAARVADLIIVATRCDTDLPASVKDWLNCCANRKMPGQAMLVGLLGSPQTLSDVARRTREFLQSAAERNVMDFFLHEVDSSQTGSELTVETLQKRANTVSRVVPGNLGP